MLLGSIQTEMSEDDSLTKPVTIVHGKNIVIDRRPFAELAPASSPPASSPPASSPALIARNQRLELRFRKALKKNDATMLKRSLELGYVPSDRQWVTSSPVCMSAPPLVVLTWRAPCQLTACRLLFDGNISSCLRKLSIVLMLYRHRKWMS